MPVSQGGVPIPVEDYAYDEEGNRTASHLSALYSSNNHNQLLEDDSYTYAYDLKGNRTSRTEKATGDVETYSYDSQNRLVGYVSPTTTASYAYDALDRRVGKVVGAAQTAYVYDMSQVDPLAHDDIVMEWDTASFPTLTRRWLHSPSVDEPVGFEDYVGTSGVGSGTERSMFADRQGSVIWVTDTTSSSIVAAYQYDGYGVLTQTQGSLSQPFGYTGREFDAESGLYHYRARSYDPRTGSFVQSDPLMFNAGQLGLYVYVANDPFGWGDPSGLSTAVECGTGRAKGGACGSMAGLLSGAFNGILSLGQRIALAMTRIGTFAMNFEDSTGLEKKGKESKACRDAEARLDQAQERSKKLGGGCSKLYKWQKKNIRSPEVQAMLLARM